MMKLDGNLRRPDAGLEQRLQHLVFEAFDVQLAEGAVGQAGEFKRFSRRYTGKLHEGTGTFVDRRAKRAFRRIGRWGEANHRVASGQSQREKLQPAMLIVRLLHRRPARRRGVEHRHFATQARQFEFKAHILPGPARQHRGAGFQQRRTDPPVGIATHQLDARQFPPKQAVEPKSSRASEVR